MDMLYTQADTDSCDSCLHCLRHQAGTKPAMSEPYTIGATSHLTIPPIVSELQGLPDAPCR